MDSLLVMTNCPDAASAEHLARHLVDQRLAACVNILAPCRSIYRWQGSLESASEVPLLIKTPAAAYSALEEEILRQHPYEIPEIIALPIAQGLPAYLDWLATETSAC